MRPIPAPRLGDTHGLLRAINERERLRLDEFITEFSIEELFPPGLENALGRTRQFVSFARSAGLLKEDRGVVELTEVGKRYVRSADAASVFEVSPGQAEWLRRQLFERHMTDSIYHGAAIGLSLYASNPAEFHVSKLDFGRALAHLGRAGWDNENTLESQGERYTTFLRDLELLDEQSRLTEVGAQTKAELTLPIHASLRDLAGQLNPGGPDAAQAEGQAEWATDGAAAEPEPVEEPQPVEEPAAEGPAIDTGEYEDVAGAARAASTAAGGRPVPPSDIWETAAPDEATRAYSSISPEQAAAAAVEPAAGEAAPDEAPAAEEAPAAQEPAAAQPPADAAAEADAAAAAALSDSLAAEEEPAGMTSGDPLASGEMTPGDPLAGPAPTAEPAGVEGPGVESAAPDVAADEPAADAPVPVVEVPAGLADEVVREEPAVEQTPAAEPEAEAPVAEPPAADEPPAAQPAPAAEGDLIVAEAGGEPVIAEPADAPPAPEVSVPPPAHAEPAVAEAPAVAVTSTRSPSGFLDIAAVRAAAAGSGLTLPDSVYAGLVAALSSGKHLVIAGPAGSGKTTLALAVAKAAVQAGRSEGAALTTASPSWGAGDTVGRVGDAGFSQGHVLAAAGKKKWLIIDEIDRAKLDEAFGDLSSFLGGLPLSLPDGSREVAAPKDWRIVATRDSGRGTPDASPALLRRFAEIHLPRPGAADLERAIDAATDGDPTAAAAVKRLLADAALSELGAALFLDAARHAAERNALVPATEEELERECREAYIAPHLRGA
ncbi:MAG TPA: AAA family ATPase [Solirubrobacteraceae bacterium]|nr:AAA family ATPase [Solirubrobacteraceae bacterium]